MNQRVTSPGTAKGRRAWLFLSLLLPAVASKVSTQNSSAPIRADSEIPPYPRESSRPYLRVVAAPALRFEDLPPPPDLSVHPPAGAPPKVAEKDKTTPDVVLPKPVPHAADSAAKATEIRVASAASAEPAMPAAPTPPRILPDDVPIQVRPEDFLPYFQYPGMNRRIRGEGAPPGTPTLPASSATYEQND
jgi:hypothetical protein